MNTTKVVIYTPAQDFWYNSDLGASFLLWLFSLFIAVLIVSGVASNARRELRNWQFISLVILVTWLIQFILTKALIYL